MNKQSVADMVARTCKRIVCDVSCTHLAVLAAVALAILCHSSNIQHVLCSGAIYSAAVLPTQQWFGTLLLFYPHDSDLPSYKHLV